MALIINELCGLLCRIRNYLIISTMKNLQKYVL